MKKLEKFDDENQIKVMSLIAETLEINNIRLGDAVNGMTNYIFHVFMGMPDGYKEYLKYLREVMVKTFEMMEKEDGKE